MIIAIDGPSGSGKSTTARLLAQHLDITHLDTGAMYRVVTWGLKKENINIDDIASVNSFLEKTKILYKNANEIMLNGKLVSTEIRKKDITSSVSEVSALRPLLFFRALHVQVHRCIKEYLLVLVVPSIFLRKGRILGASFQEE